MQAQMLAPAAALVAWTLIMMLWMMATRLPALGKAGINLQKAPPGGRGQDLDGQLPANVNWKAHNYVHLLEQPTLFYAAVAIIAIVGPGPHDAWWAWGYVIFRVAHSLWQATVNRIPLRFTLFLLSTVCLVALAIRALSLTLVA